MEITNSLLVALMFVTLLSMGIGNIVTSLATMVDRRTPLRLDAIHTSWVVLLLLVYMNLFWHVLDILTVEQWKFYQFLYIVSGAIFIFFATQVLLPDPTSEDAGNLRAHYFSVSRQFFFLFALSQAWTIGVDLSIGGDFDPSGATILNAIATALALILSRTSAPGAHKAGAVTMWLLFLIAVGFGITESA